MASFKIVITASAFAILVAFIDQVTAASHRQNNYEMTIGNLNLPANPTNRQQFKWDDLINANSPAAGNNDNKVIKKKKSKKDKKGKCRRRVHDGDKCDTTLSNVEDIEDT